MALKSISDAKCYIKVNGESPLIICLRVCRALFLQLNTLFQLHSMLSPISNDINKNDKIFTLNN